MTNEQVDTFGDDEEHPIPYVTALDLFGVLGRGGADLAIIVASPLRADERSQRRLLQKIENYLGFISSEEFLSKVHSPSGANTRIIVKLHPDSDAEISHLLQRCADWVASNNATLVLERL